jgi:hypothetical protein
MISFKESWWMKRMVVVLLVVVSMRCRWGYRQCESTL